MNQRLMSVLFHVALAGLSVFLAASTASATTTGILWIYGSQTLTENHKGLVVLADDNARLDCDGYRIYEGGQNIAACGPEQDQTCGIYAVGVDAPYVIDCIVEDYQIGMYISAANLPTVRNSTFRDNDDGMYVEYTDGSSGTFILSNTFRDNRDEGLVCRHSNGLRLTSNNFWYNGSDGVDADHCDSLYVSNSYHYGNGSNGLELDYCDNVSIRSSRFNNNGAVTNDHSGLSLDYSDSAYIDGNTFNSNTRNGLRITSDSDGGTISNNRGDYNDEADAYQSSSSSNTWTNNDFGSTSPTGLN